ncbi:FAD-dependent oxidoreductase [Solirhodobacter olei]|uniref:FAD-dependent oxidoreductase n=1 Tax=Solirhodobacter olei TaxID=2493082 RepID=UPI000FD8A7A5|nr:FAD-dependent oxidoreductase [Solirhodobacter olei]
MQLEAVDSGRNDFDLVVLGSGAGGLTAALTAALEGLRVVVLEHAARVGGTSARSSGTVWIPDNHHLRARGVEDDRKKAEAYLSALVGGHGDERMWRAFLDAAPRMAEDLERRGGICFSPLMESPDYRQDCSGAALGGRAIAPLAFDGRLLGREFARLDWPLPELMLFGRMMITRPEAQVLLRFDRSPRAAWLGAQLVARYVLDRLGYERGTRLVLGNALVARLLKAAQDHGVDVRTGVEPQRFVADAGRIVELVCTEGGRETRYEARRGFVLAGGGFPANAEMRSRELPQPTPDHTPAAPGCDGSTLALALVAGARLGPSGRDNGLWFPSSISTRANGSTAVYPHIVLDRSKPGLIAVDATGRRFVNEAVSYHEFVRAMYASGNRAVPAWLVCDRSFINKYGLGMVRPRTPSLKKFVQSGYLREAASICELAKLIAVPGEALVGTVERYNTFAQTGVDADFGKGETIYDRSNGDPAVAPNPCIGSIAAGPFYAVAVWPTPLGTSRGLVADAGARVLGTDGAPIPGLYVCGNDMQSAFGGEYPGAGAQLGQAMTFGWLAGRDAAGVPAADLSETKSDRSEVKAHG